jgi:hypothetical protein
LSATGVVTPEVSLGIWRLICRNSAIDELMSAAKWTGGSKSSMGEFEKSMERMASIAVPFGNVLGDRCDELYEAPLDLSPRDCLDKMLDIGAISSAHAEKTSDLFEHGYGQDMPNGQGQWGMFNALTDAAKDLNPIQSRRKAESRAMTLAMQSDGFNGVCRNGLNIIKSRADMTKFVGDHEELSDILAKVSANN